MKKLQIHLFHKFDNGKNNDRPAAAAEVRALMKKRKKAESFGRERTK